MGTVVNVRAQARAQACCQKAATRRQSAPRRWRFSMVARPQPVGVASSHLEPCRHTRIRQRLLMRASNDTESVDATTMGGIFTLSLPTRDARSSITLSVVPDGCGQAILVSAVEAGSAAELAGVRPGLRLRGISDPIRDEVWPLQDRPSLRYVRETLRMRRAESIELQFESSSLPLPRVAPDGSMNAAGGSSFTAAPSSSAQSSASSSMDGSSSVFSSLESFELSTDASSSRDGSGSGSRGTIAERLQAQYEQAQKEGQALTAVQERIQRRKAVMDEMDQRNDSGFLLLMFAAFVVPSLIIMLVAWSSGYLDHLYNNTLTLRG